MNFKDIESRVHQKEISISDNDLKLQSNFKLMLIGATGQAKYQIHYLISFKNIKYYFSRQNQYDSEVTEVKNVC